MSYIVPYKEYKDFMIYADAGQKKREPGYKNRLDEYSLYNYLCGTYL
jgi:hypothetical protein